MKITIACFIQCVIFPALRIKYHLNPDIILTPDLDCDRVTVYCNAQVYLSYWVCLRRFRWLLPLTWLIDYFYLCWGRQWETTLATFCAHKLKINFLFAFVLFSILISHYNCFRCFKTIYVLLNQNSLSDRMEKRKNLGRNQAQFGGGYSSPLARRNLQFNSNILNYLLF